MNSYQARALEGASPVEVTIALYDGIVRFMNEAMDAVEQNDADRRRAAVKRAMDIVMHLQVTLDRKRGGKPAEALTEFYTAMFALMLQGSQANSRQKFEQVIANVRNVREAWKQALAETMGYGASMPAGSKFDGVMPQFAMAQREGSWTA
ncbi:flagellar export chaperone FliS [Occallatibacter savannae]|uniref:flagellar export chaperone FliS n=1 Tax=Occallatibacter savannae TaxID=1002691 RepID=UPI0013A5499A|nr:flagellar export chaperone FliS [Occallatibacter savannae]